MNKFTKTLIATALLAGAGAANAAIVTTSADGNANELFLVAYDPTGVSATLGKTYNLNTHITYGQLTANAATALSALSSINLAGDANWTNFTGSIANPANVKYVLTVGNASSTNSFGIGTRLFSTGGTSTPQPNGSLSNAGGVSAIAAHAAEINAGMGANNSSLILDLAAGSDGTGQADGISGPLSIRWAGTDLNVAASYGTAVDFLFAGSHNVTLPGPRGTTRTIEGFTAEDIVNLGKITLAGNSLSFAPAVSNVPLPAAVWMFGAGLMGILRANRRKSIQA
jgi:hypothetical protein